MHLVRLMIIGNQMFSNPYCSCPVSTQPTYPITAPAHLHYRPCPPAKYCPPVRVSETAYLPCIRPCFVLHRFPCHVFSKPTIIFLSFPLPTSSFPKFKAPLSRFPFAVKLEKRIIRISCWIPTQILSFGKVLLFVLRSHRNRRSDNQFSVGD